MKFKALIFDLDGTAFPTGLEHTPSQKLKETVLQAQKRVSVSIATARRIASVTQIFKDLSLTSPSIITGGTQIVDPVLGEILWSKHVEKESLLQILNIMKGYPSETILGDELSPFDFTSFNIPNKTYPILYLRNPTKEMAEEICIKLKNVSNISFVTSPSWIKGWTDIHVTHSEGTKKTGVQHLLTLLKVQKDEVMVVGDNNNDEALFESAGFKVAMGNATDALKNKADFIAPTVTEDGLAYVIEKYII
jgi:HAD superfamily hydrolase (TIGR01484 family)